MIPITLNLESVVKLTPEQFCRLCESNPETKLEMTSVGELVVMSPTGGMSGNRNIKISHRVESWADADGTGVAFDSSTMFKLPNGAFRSPDAAWILLERWNQLSSEQQETFPPICPDFVIELRFKTDSLRSLQDKMQEYINNGVRLGFLLNPYGKQVEVYRQGCEKDVLDAPMQLSGETVLPGFVLKLAQIL
ncbi:MAG: Uma2 family endonuclease [Timaviella obliquedivisa GSE-PSE-MK23-08B]|jgi:Uma2 family endonuclease|nr:Uma2 family endonuclease [Timaviella obliquedivisa GSE-PSE-MK23-08B]